MSRWAPRLERARPRLRRDLRVSQRSSTLLLTMTFAAPVEVVAVWARPTRTSSAPDPATTPTPSLRSRLAHVLAPAGPPSDATQRTASSIVLPATVTVGSRSAEITVDLLDLAGRAEQAPGPYALFIELEQPLRAARWITDGLAARPGVATVLERAGRPVMRFSVPIANFDRTRLDPFTPTADGVRQAHPYVTTDGTLAVALNAPLKPFAEVAVRRLVVRGGRLRMRARLRPRDDDIHLASLVLKGRATGARLEFPLALPAATVSVAGGGRREYRVELSLDLAAALGRGDLVEDVYDAWLRVASRNHPEGFDTRVGRTRFLARRLTSGSWAVHGGLAAYVDPYYTAKAKRTSIRVHLFDEHTVAYLRRMLRLRWLLRLRNAGRHVWLVGERPSQAQDNGFHFFRYLRTHHREIDAYYVIRAGAPDYEKVASLGHVLAYGSKQHVRVALLAERVIGSHHPDFLFPVRTAAFARAIRATKVFLQHGVIGIKWVGDTYGRDNPTFDTDLFVVSSEREKEFIVADLGYPSDDVVVTGLARFDALFAGDVPRRRQVLVMPTWRDWLLDADTYLASDFHERWSALLRHPRLHEVAAAHGLEVVLCLHANMQAFTPLFTGVGVRVVSQGEVDVQRLLKESAVLVTDYSSVGWDFSFLDKPVVFYQFDADRAFGARGSHLDLASELPGPVTRSAADTVAEIERAAARGFSIGAEYRSRASAYIQHRDQGNCQRIFAEVLAARPRRHRQPLTSSEPAQLAYKLFRRSRLYLQAMKALFRVVRALPVASDLVVFESGVGKQYADSPRAVYEELLRRASPLRKVWVYPGKLHTRDQWTRTVTRNSPAYFYFLARARYWVNNQNFANYIHRRHNGVYVQTWHGTPLKRMLYDIDMIRGRDRGYVERVTEASRQWSLLVSPSPFFTEAMRSAFRYTGPVLETGYPRNDLFFRADREAIAERVRRRLGIPRDRTVVLYAPTFRDDESVGGNRFAFTLALDLAQFTARFGGKAILLVRLHVLIRDPLVVPPGCEHSVFDVTSYPDIQELFLVSDVLVTDYSSVFFDFAALRRPMIFYAYDLPAYRDELRGFYLDYERDLPGPIVTTQEDLLDTLADLDRVDDAYASRYDAFVERFGPYDDGNAAGRVVDEVFGDGVVAQGRA